MPVAFPVRSNVSFDRAVPFEEGRGSLLPAARLAPAPQPDEVVAGHTALLSGESWAEQPGVSVVVTFSFSAAAPGYVRDDPSLGESFAASFQPFNETEQFHARAALNAWGDESGIIFIEDTAGTGDIQFGKYDLSRAEGIGEDTAGFAYYPVVELAGGESYQISVGGDVFIDIDNNYTFNSDTDRLLLLHEIGHALGLKHPFEDDPTLAPAFDNTNYTVMAYEGPIVDHIQVLDRDAIHHLYGFAGDDGNGLPPWSWDSPSNTLTYTGTEASEAIRGVMGRNVIAGNGGDDTLLAGDLAGSTLDGGEGADDLTGGYASDLLAGGGGNDTLYDGGGGGFDTMRGGAGDDFYQDSTTLNIFEEAAGGGNDTLTLYGTNPVFALTPGAEIETVSAASSYAWTIAGNEFSQRIQGNNYANSLSGGAGDDTLDGGSGADTLAGGAGTDTLIGGADDDTYLDAAGDTIQESANGGIDWVHSGSTMSLESAANVEHLRLTGGGAISGTGNALANRIVGNESDNTLAGGGGSDTLTGGGGKDVLDGGAGADQLIGGAGNDTFVNPVLGAGGDTIVEAAGPEGGNDLVFSDAAFSLAALATVERLALTGTAAVSGTGNALDNQIFGNASDNALDGGAGNDTLTGGLGNDRLTGGEGADRLVGGDGSDTYVNPVARVDRIVEAAGAAGGNDLILSQDSLSLAAFANVERLGLTGSGDAGGTGNDLANRISGNSGNNALDGGKGDDTLTGGDGADRLTGGAGTDRLEGGLGNDIYVNPASGADTIVEAAGGGNDLVQSSATFSLAALGQVERLVLTGGGKADGTGNALANLIAGNAANNVLDGGAGNDTLTGGAGRDRLQGGAGNDTMDGGTDRDIFLFASAAAGADRIDGFETALDRFELFGGLFTARTESGGNTRLTHAGGTVLVTGVTGLDLTGWNALVLPAPAGAADALPSPDFAAAFGASASGFAHAGDYLIA